MGRTVKGEAFFSLKSNERIAWLGNRQRMGDHQATYGVFIQLPSSVLLASIERIFLREGDVRTLEELRPN